MKLHRMDLTNFRVHRNTTINFDDGLTAIVGQNESGKSSVLEGLTWALYGGPAVRGSVKGLRRRNAPARKVATVEVHLTLGGTDYRVKRTETNAWVLARRDGEPAWSQVADGTSGVTEYMTGRMGMALGEFCATYLCEQRDVARLANMGPEARRTFIRRIMGAEKIDAGVKKARRIVLDADAELRGAERQLEDAKGLERVETLAGKAHAEYEAVLRKCIKARDEQQARIDEHDRELERLDALSHRHAAIRARIGGIKSEIEVRRESRRRALQWRDRAAGQVEELRTLDKALEDFDTAKTILDRYDEKADAARKLGRMRDDLKGIDRRIAEIGDARRHDQAIVDGYDRDEHDKATGIVSTTKQVAKTLKNGRRAECAEIEVTIAQSEKRRLALGRAFGEGRCPTCGQDLKDPDETKKEIAVVDEEIRTAAGALAEAARVSDKERKAVEAYREAERRVRDLELHRTRMIDATARLAKLDEQLAGAQATRSKAERVLVATEPLADGYNPAMHQKARVVHRAMERKQARRDAIASCGDDLDRTNARIVELDGLLEGLSDKRIAAEQALEEVVYDADRHQAEKYRRAEARAELDTHRNAVTDAERRRAVAHSDLVAARQRLVDNRAREKRVGAMRRDVVFHEKVRNRLQEFRGAVLDTVKPDLADLMSGILADLTDGRHEAVTLDDSFGVVVYEDGMASPVVSGGTEDLVALVMRIALSQLIAERRGGVDLLILDEPYGSFDASRRANVTAMLESIRDVFPQILLISHVSETRHIGDHIVELEYDPDRGHTKVA